MSRFNLISLKTDTGKYACHVWIMYLKMFIFYQLK